MEDLKTLKTCGKILFPTQNIEDILLFSHQTSSLKHNFEIHNIALS